MMKASVLLVVLALLCVSVSAQLTGYSLCDNSPTGITIPPYPGNGVTLNPNPPVLGTDDKVTLTGTVNEQVTTGTVAVSISFYGFPVFSGSYNISDPAYGNTLPAGPGAFSAAVIILGSSLPQGAPPGNYVANAVVSDQNNVQLVCVNVDFTI